MSNDSIARAAQAFALRVALPFIIKKLTEKSQGSYQGQVMVGKIRILNYTHDEFSFIEFIIIHPTSLFSFF